jgi:hypothetical protein
LYIMGCSGLLLQQLLRRRLERGWGSIVERKEGAGWEGVCKRQAGEKGTNLNTEIPPVMVSEFHGFSPGTF